MRSCGFEKLIQPNDGKKSEWCEVLREGDQVDLVPIGLSVSELLGGAPPRGQRLFGFRREGRPLGAEPVVAWELQIDGGGGETAGELVRVRRSDRFVR